MVLQTAIDMSVYLEQNLNKIEEWGNILKKMPPYPLQIKDGEQVFRYSEEGTSWWNDNTLGIQHIYPAGQIGLDSDPQVLEISRNTIEIMDRWLDYNGTNSFYPAAVRVGYDPKTILMHLSELVQNTYPNGFQKNNPHGIENCSTVPNTINEMLCMGHQNVLRVFPVWPRKKDASFTNLRIPGAFLVSSDLKNGHISHIRIYSEKGRKCTVVNPWIGKPVVLQRSGGVEEILEGRRLVISTSIGERLSLQPN